MLSHGQSAHLAHPAPKSHHRQLLPLSRRHALVPRVASSSSFASLSNSGSGQKSPSPLWRLPICCYFSIVSVLPKAAWNLFDSMSLWPGLSCVHPWCLHLEQAPAHAWRTTCFKGQKSHCSWKGFDTKVSDGLWRSLQDGCGGGKHKTQLFWLPVMFVQASKLSLILAQRWHKKKISAHHRVTKTWVTYLHPVVYAKICLHFFFSVIKIEIC